jgi:hypothetical protein
LKEVEEQFSELEQKELKKYSIMKGKKWKINLLQ